MHVVYWSLILPLHVAFSHTVPDAQEIGDMSVRVEASGSTILRKVQRMPNTVAAPDEQETGHVEVGVDQSGSTIMRKVQRMPNTVAAPDEQETGHVEVGVDQSGSTIMRKTHRMANDGAASAAERVDPSGATVMRNVHRAAIGAAVNVQSSGSTDAYTEAQEINRIALMEMTLKELKKTALSKGFPQDAVDELDAKEDPKQAAIELILPQVEELTPEELEELVDGRTQAGPILLDEANTKYIEGVPIYNYHMAYEGGMSPSVLELAEAKRWVLNFPDDFPTWKIRRFCRSNSNARCEIKGHPSSGGIDFAEFTGTLAELKAALRKHGSIKPKFIEPDTVVHAIPELPDDDHDDHSSSLVEVGLPWGLDRIDDKRGQDGSYNAPGKQGDGAHVYIADTGVNVNHQDFEGRASLSHESLGGRVRVCSSSSSSCARDNDGHGTHCAGTVGGKKYGVAKKTKLYSAKVLNPSGFTSAIVASLDWVMSSGRKPAVWSASLGGSGTSRTYDNAFQRAVGNGVVVVVAAGNENTDACTKEPAFSRYAITVGATQTGDRRASFSNWGSCVQIFAPGKSIESASHRSNRGSTTLSGTSMACPHVSGAAALLLADGTSASGVWNALKSKAGSGIVSDPRGSPNRMLYVGSGDGGGDGDGGDGDGGDGDGGDGGNPSPPSGTGKTKDKGCACSSGWRLQGRPYCGGCCDTYRMNGQKWCVVEEQACQGRWWGYCEIPTAKPTEPPEKPTEPPAKPTAPPRTNRPPPVSGSGAEPVYEFWNENDEDHSYHFDEARPGERKKGLAFWAFREKP